MTCHQVREQLSAYVDGELSLSESVAIEQHVGTCSDCSRALEELRALSGALVGARFEAPESLRRSLETQIQPKRNRFAWPRANVLALAVVACVVLAFFVGRITVHPSMLMSEIVASHSRSLLVNHLVDVESSDRHTVKPWFIGKIDYSPTPYDLKQVGYELKGGRLDYVDGQTVPVYVYQHQKHVINLYVFKGDKAMDQSDINGYHMVRWTGDGFTYIAVSDVATETLRSFQGEFEKASKGQ